MKCEDINMLACAEGQAPAEAVAHIGTCTKCRSESEKMSKFSKLVSAHYVEGKQIEDELNRRLRSIDCSKMKKLPENLQKKTAGLKEKSLVSRLTAVLEKTKTGDKRILGDILTSHSYAMAASPKDITKAKGSRKKRKK